MQYEPCYRTRVIIMNNFQCMRYGRIVPQNGGTTLKAVACAAQAQRGSLAQTDGLAQLYEPWYRMQYDPKPY